MHAVSCPKAGMNNRRITGGGVFLSLLLLLDPVASPGQQPEAFSSIDSLDLKILEIRIQEARERVSQSSLVRRIIPRIHFTASFGVNEIFFIDPLTADPYVLPHDAFRLTLSLPVTEIFDFSRQNLACLELARLELERRKAEIEQAHRGEALRGTLIRLEHGLEQLKQEELLKSRLVDYSELLFEQGKTDYDTLIRARLQLLSLKRSMLDLEQRIEDARRALE